MNTQENSAHSYTEGSDQFKKFSIYDESQRSIASDSTSQLTTCTEKSQSKEELRKEFDELILVCRTNNGRPDWALIQDNFDWFYSKLSQKEQEIDRLKKEREPISELLAILHRDGGHYQEKHGLEKAIKDAIKLIHTEWVNKDEVDRLKKELEELKK